MKIYWIFINDPKLEILDLGFQLHETVQYGNGWDDIYYQHVQEAGIDRISGNPVNPAG